MAAKVSDVPNSKYHSLFFILGQRAASTSRSGAAPCPSPAGSRMGFQSLSGAIVKGTRAINGDTSHRGEGRPAPQPQGAVLWDRSWLRRTWL